MMVVIATMAPEARLNLFAFVRIVAVALGVIHSMVVIVGKSEPGYTAEHQD
jgi:hypothetical protein